MPSYPGDPHPAHPPIPGPPAPASASSPHPAVPIELTERPYLMKGFRARARSRAVPIRDNTVVLDGVGSLEWKPWACILGVASSDRSDVTNSGNPQQGAFSGSVKVELQGLTAAGFVYLRRFNLAPVRSVVFDVSGFEDLSIRVLTSGINGADVVANVTNHPINTRPTEWVLLQETCGPSAVYLAPPGARYLVAQQADAGFDWSMDGAAFYPEPGGFAAGDLSDVMGLYYRPSVASFIGTWRVYL